MAKRWSDDQKIYIASTGINPKTTDQELTMNYCLAWCKAYGKSIADWCNAGYNNAMYSPVKDKRKQELLRLTVEKMEAK